MRHESCRPFHDYAALWRWSLQAAYFVFQLMDLRRNNTGLWRISVVMRSIRVKTYLKTPVDIRERRYRCLKFKRHLLRTSATKRIGGKWKFKAQIHTEPVALSIIAYHTSRSPWTITCVPFSNEDINLDSGQWWRSWCYSVVDLGSQTFS